MEHLVPFLNMGIHLPCFREVDEGDFSFRA